VFYPFTKKLIFPLDNYKADGLKFGSDYADRNKHWGIHLGQDILCPANTSVKSIGKGSVVYSAIHPGTKEKPNWGNIIIIAHRNPKTEKIFYSLYGHLKNRLMEKGDNVSMGKIIGAIGQSNTPENGYWKAEHLHFAIYTGRWTGKVLPGYYKEEDKRTRLSDWQDPEKFIRRYNKELVVFPSR
jgi:murein DD-endopeptidase MepM/ murein hydrolase activator NlpD